MKKYIKQFLNSDFNSAFANFGMLFFRVAVASELIVVHGLKKLGIGVATAEVIPNPLGFPEAFNNFVAIAANVFLPFLLIIGLCTRLSALPALAVTATGYFIMHGNDPAPLRDIPFMYSVSLLTIILMGPGKYSLDNHIAKSINR